MNMVTTGHINTTKEQAEYVLQAASDNMVSAAQVVRWAIRSLMENPDREAPRPTTKPQYPYSVATSYIPQDQMDFIKERAKEKGVSKSQIYRDAVFSLQMYDTTITIKGGGS